jgi:molybdenum cofactor guanylyltransferase
MSPSSITGLILAGGQGLRMGGADKGLAKWKGEMLAAHALRRLAPQVSSCMISANRNIAEYEKLGVPVLRDALDGYAGPLAGLQSGLAHCSTPWLACVPCDAPLLPADLVERLARDLDASSTGLSIAVTSEGTLRRRHPVFCLVSRALLPALSDYLAGGGRRFVDWCDAAGAVEVEFADRSAFLNLNTGEDLRP